MINVLKRDGREKQFDSRFIEIAVDRAKDEVNCEDEDLGFRIGQLVEETLIENDIQEINIEDIQDLVIEFLNQENKDVATAYKGFRNKREVERIKRSKTERFYDEVLNCSNIDNDNSNVDQHSFSGRKYRIADYEQKQYALRNLISEEGRKAFEEGSIYYHDLASYAIGEHNCLNLDIKSGLKNGFVTRNGDVRPANSYSTACQLVAVMFQCESQVQFGGVGANIFDYSLEDYVKKSFRKYFIKGMKYIEGYSKKEARHIVFTEIPDNLTSIEDERYKKYTGAYNYAMEELEDEGKQATQGLYHNLNTLESRAGSQLPFTSINLGRDISPEGRLINKWVFNASLEGIGKLKRTPIFPISIFQYKKGVNDKEGTPNYDLKKLALKSLSKRIYPNFVNGDYRGNIEIEDNPNTYMATMGCRTMTGYNQYTNDYDKAGRGNLSPITIILPKIGLDYGIALKQRDKADIEGFFNKLDDTLELVKNELIARTEYMFKQSPKSAPFIYDNTIMKGAEDCKGKDNVKECLKHGTLAVGILGMAECCIAMFGKHHGESIEAYEFALKVVRRIYDFCKEATEETEYNFGQYFTPAENLCKTARNTLALYYGEIEGVTTNKFLTNSIHIPVYYQIDAFSKITLEAPFTQYGTAGCITYVELDNASVNNLEGLERIVDFAMDLNIPYLATNFPIDTCKRCGYSSQIDGDKCPNCGSEEIERLKRVTGYITVDYRNFNDGKIDEVHKRVKHTIYNPQVKPVLEVARKKLEEMGIIKVEI